MSVFNDALHYMREQAKRSDSVLVAYSGGKDSLVVMDLCVRTFKRVVGFNMFLAPDMDDTKERIQFAKDRWNVPVISYPHWVGIRALKQGVYCDQTRQHDALPDWELRDIYNLAKHDTGIPLIAHGAKETDSLWRKRFFHATRSWTDLIYPVKQWTKLDVLGYLKANSIPIPGQTAKMAHSTALGCDLTIPSLLYWHDNHPEDFKKIARMFPYVWAVIKRRELYGDQT